MFGVPLVLARKEDAVGQKEFSGDVNDPAQLEALLLRVWKKLERAIQNEPQIKITVGGAFLDMIKRGIFKR